MYSLFRNQRIVAAVSDQLRRHYSDTRRQEPSNAAKLFVLFGTFGFGFTLGAYNSQFIIDSIANSQDWFSKKRVTMREVEKIEYGYTLDEEPEEAEQNGTPTNKM